MDKLTQLKNFLKAKQVPFTQGELQDVINFVTAIETDMKPKVDPTVPPIPNTTKKKK